MSDSPLQPPQEPKLRPSWPRIAVRLVFLGITVVVLYLFLPQIVAFMSESSQLTSIDWYWYVMMGVLTMGTFVSAWELTRVAVPGISMFVAATSQLVSNALAKVVPGGPVAGGGVYWQMLSVSGVPKGQAASALAAVSFISNLVLLSLPGVAIVIAAVSAPIPDGLLPVAVAGSVLFAFMFAAVFILVKYDAVLLFVGRIVARSVGWLARKFHKPWTSTAQGWLDRRNEVVDALGARWFRALAAAVLNWLFEYGVLVAALIGVGAKPRASLVLVAFAGSAVLGMIPLTPGGIGFVEVGLVGMLVAAGIPGNDATLATLAYRLFQFWIPIPAGLVAYIAFRRRHGRLEDLPAQA
ncbi:MAG: lysylphosphatidylglycerol synthase transmembrane domain-containing protein [Acidimicrobiia bacterium]